MTDNALGREVTVQVWKDDGATWSQVDSNVITVTVNDGAQTETITAGSRIRVFNNYQIGYYHHNGDVIGTSGGQQYKRALWVGDQATFDWNSADQHNRDHGINAIVVPKEIKVRCGVALIPGDDTMMFSVTDVCGRSSTGKLTFKIKNPVKHTDSGITPTVVGLIAVCMVLAVIIIVGVVVYCRRNRDVRKKDTAYESHFNDPNKDLDHVYKSTNRVYINEQISMDQQPSQLENTQVRSLTELLRVLYYSSDLAERLHNKEEHKLRLSAEIMYLSLTEPENNGYETNVREDLSDNTITLFKKTTSYSILTKLPESITRQQFWQMVNEPNHVNKIVMVLERTDKIDEILPSFDNPLIFDEMRVDFESAETFGTSSLLISVRVKHNEDLRTVKILKTIKDNSERLLPQHACSIIEKVMDRVDDRILFAAGTNMMNDIATFAICCNGVKKIKLDEPFNIMLDAENLKSLKRDWFDENKDLQYCYDVLREYLESVHTYDTI